MVFLRDEKQETGFRVSKSRPQQITLVYTGPPVVVEDNCGRPFGIVYPRGECFRISDVDRGRRSLYHGGVRFVRGLNGVGPPPTVSRALGLSSTRSRHSVGLLERSSDV